MASVLGSKWDGMSGHLIASLYQVGRGSLDAPYARVQDGVTVVAPLIDANIEFALTWQSPFESAGADTQAPFFSAMVQTGGLIPVLDKLGDFAKKLGIESEAGKAGKDYLQKGVGQASITKLNSTQVFTGMPPVKITANLLFRAWDDPRREVEAPVDQVINWALPREISNDASAILRLAEASTKDEMTYLEALYPSKAPVMVGLTYKGRTYLPLVIESVGLPITAPTTADGVLAEVMMPVTLCTLTALDRNDWSGTKVQSL